MAENTKIFYTKTDEAPALATYSLLPIVQTYTKAADVILETKDISLAGRILSQFPQKNQRQILLNFLILVLLFRS